MPDALPDIHIYIGYHIYFWSDEGKPLEPIHVHFHKGKPTKDATKYWINEDGSIEQEHNKSKIPANDLRKLEKIITKYSKEIIKKWKEYFGEEPKYHTSKNQSAIREVQSLNPAIDLDDFADDFGDR